MKIILNVKNWFDIIYNLKTQKLNMSRNCTRKKCSICKKYFTNGPCFNRHFKACEKRKLIKDKIKILKKILKHPGGVMAAAKHLKCFDYNGHAGSSPAQGILICQYGCGNRAKYILKNGKLCCSRNCTSCDKVREKNSEAIKKAHKDGRVKSWPKEKQSWWKFKTEKEVNEIRKRQGNTYKENARKGLHTGHKGWRNIKYYKIFCKYLNKKVTVQGNWELQYALYLDENNINWSRGETLKYFLPDKSYHYYYPDFYLPDIDEYREIKGKLSEKVKIKMKQVKKYNKNVKIVMLRYKDLKDLGLKV